VAVVASNIQVSTVYGETGLGIVIEQPQVPGDRVMAGLTVALKFASVRIVIKVAVDALGAGFGKHLGFMAGLALDIAMLSQERKSRQVMNEKLRIVPFCLGVAVVAPLTLLAVMNLVIKMTGGAGNAG